MIRFAYGSISDAQISGNLSSIHYNAPDKKPYYEYGFGIENIGFGNLKFFRADFIWRSPLPLNFKTNSPKNKIQVQDPAALHRVSDLRRQPPEHSRPAPR